MKRPFVLLAGLAIAGMLGVGLWFGVSRVAAQAPTPTPGSQAPTQSARGWLGVILQESNGQVIISQVLPGSPAAQAGVQANDRLVSINGQNVTTIQQVQNILNPAGARHDGTAGCQPQQPEPDDQRDPRHGPSEGDGTARSARVRRTVPARAEHPLRPLARGELQLCR
ncbi:MAG: hypothetical protein KatS3mg061_1213 [Dehalococcoidia bacterium]|nr:MAG: hypothetical protein KatS3mg061_1213 [Dehalococcoidia bacterium]